MNETEEKNMTVAESVRAKKARKGPASGVDARGAYWRSVDVEIIDNYNQVNGARRRFRLTGDHYRSGGVVLHLHGRFDMGTERISDWAEELNDAENCTTIEALASAIEQALHGQGDPDGSPPTQKMSRWGFRQLREAFPGLPVAEPAPDEVPA